VVVSSDMTNSPKRQTQAVREGTGESSNSLLESTVAFLKTAH